MRRSTWLAIPLLLLAACDSLGIGDGDDGTPADGGGDTGDFGATPGGVKDMRFARDLIARGQVPPPEALLVEGMFAEHDLGLDGEPCADLLCLRAAAGVAPDRSGQPRGWLQVGLSSSVDPDAWPRPATTFIFVVDVSGSMGWDYTLAPTPGHLARELLHRLTDELGRDDEVAIVTFGGESAIALPVRDGGDPDGVHAAIDALAEDGSTNLEAGLTLGYQVGEDAVARGRDQVRVILFTDVQPNVGSTEPSDFEVIVADGAERGIELTSLALGLGIGPEVLERIAHLRGANAFSLIDILDVDTFMSDEYPWFTTPIAYDLEISVAPGAGLALHDTFGFPGDFAAAPRLDVSTVFLSKRKGALLASLRADAPAALDMLSAGLSFAFTTPAGATTRRAASVDRAGAPLDQRGHWFGQPAVARTTALALLVSGMREAATAYAAAPADAVALMQATHERFAADAAALADPTLDPEVALSARMLELMVASAPQGSLYPR